MNTLRLLSLGLAITAALLLVSGSLGFTSTTADRGVSVGVADDENAYVGYDEVPHAPFDFVISVEGHPEHSLVEIENRLDSPLEVTGVESESDTIGVDLTGRPTNVGAGSNADITGRLTCNDAFIAKERVGITVEVEATSVEAEIDGETTSREFTVLCVSNPFDNLELKHSQRGGMSTATTAQSAPGMRLGERVTAGQRVRAELAIMNENGTVERVSGSWTVPRGGLETDLGNGYELVGVELQGQGVSFTHPNRRAAQRGNGDIDIQTALNSPALDTFDPE
ncbi:hypothetical protein [Halovenus sp. HT40]|uniref:hypothetical protein n=1 Tax=Halovenus sp. HT40 TaxID=3126691 RepID=UPI00300F2066